MSSRSYRFGLQFELPANLKCGPESNIEMLSAEDRILSLRPELGLVSQADTQFAEFHPNESDQHKLR